MPQLWVLTGPKSGDNAQALLAAQVSGLAYETRNVTIRPGRLNAKPGIRASLADIDPATSDQLRPPWPDAVLTIGRHLSRVALWIKEQSGSRTRIVLLNAPKGRWRDFDLVILPPYYRNLNRSNVLTIRMPLIGILPDRLEAARRQFESRLSGMPRPLHVLLVGGDMGQRRLQPNFMGDVLRRMIAGFAAEGSIYVVTSRRTPAAVADTLAAGLRPRDRLYSGDSADAENPYLGLLAHGDTFTVTADSISMLIEVARLGRPLAIAEPPPLRGIEYFWQWASDLLRPRDLGNALSILYEGGHAVSLCKAMCTPSAPLPDDSDLVARTLRQLVGLQVEQGLRYRYEYHQSLES